jgi:HK97 gp10 family phage protein
MVKVSKSKGKGFVNVEIKGINEVLQRLQKNERRIVTASSIELVRTANFIQNEVQESIIGNRAETKSVDSGTFANSIDIKLQGKESAIIFPKRQKYTNSKSTTEDVAKFMDFGTRKIKPRRHFRNTKDRNQKKIVREFKTAIDLAVK